MATFREILQDIVNKSDEDKLRLALTALSNLRPVLAQLDKETNGVRLVCAILSTAAAADGKLSGIEYSLIENVMKAEHVTLSQDEILSLVRNYGNKNGYELIQKVSQVLPSSNKGDLVIAIASVCALDDRISSDELHFIESLL